MLSKLSVDFAHESIEILGYTLVQILTEVTEFDKHADCIMTLFEVYLEMTKFVDSRQDPNQHFGLFVDTIC